MHTSRHKCSRLAAASEAAVSWRRVPFVSTLSAHLHELGGGASPGTQPRLPLLGRDEAVDERLIKRGGAVQEVEARPSQAHVLGAGQGVGLRARQRKPTHELSLSERAGVTRRPHQEVGRAADGSPQDGARALRLTRPSATMDAGSRCSTMRLMRSSLSSTTSIVIFGLSSPL